MAWGEYPKEYNSRVHGTYMPSRWYGKPDTPFGQVKLAELPAWFGRRNKSPIAASQAVGRAFWRWRFRYMDPVNAGIGGPLQALGAMMLFFYLINTNRYWTHRNAKYHW